MRTTLTLIAIALATSLGASSIYTSTTLPLCCDNYAMTPVGLLTDGGFELWSCSGHLAWPPDEYSGEWITREYESSTTIVARAGAYNVDGECLRRSSLHEACLPGVTVGIWRPDSRILAYTATKYTDADPCDSQHTESFVLITYLTTGGYSTYYGEIHAVNPGTSWGVGHPVVLPLSDRYWIWVWDESAGVTLLYAWKSFAMSFVGATDVPGILDDVVIADGGGFRGLWRKSSTEECEVTSQDGLAWDTAECHTDWQFTSPSWVHTATGRIAQPETILGYSGNTPLDFRIVRYSPGAVAPWLPPALKGARVPIVVGERRLGQ